MVSLSADCLIRASGADVTGSDDYRKVVDELCRGRGMGTFLSLSDIVLKLRAAMYDDPHREHFLVTAASCFAAADSGLSLRIAALEEQIRAMQAGRFGQAVPVEVKLEAPENVLQEEEERPRIPDEQILSGFVPEPSEGYDVPFDENPSKTSGMAEGQTAPPEPDDEDWGAFDDLDSLFGGSPAPGPAVKSVWNEAPKPMATSGAVEASGAAQMSCNDRPAKDVGWQADAAGNLWGHAARHDSVGDASPEVQEAEPFAAAKKAEQVFNQMMWSEPALKIHMQQRAVRTQYSEKGLQVFCRDMVVMKLILAFVGRYQLTGVEVALG